MTIRVGVIGSGFISKGLVLSLENCCDLKVSKVLTRSDVRARVDFPRPDLLAGRVEELLATSDVVVECSGDVLHATEMADAVLASGLPLVTMDAELQVTTGSYFAGRGVFTEAEGDQPGCLAALNEDVVQMGFRPLVFGNIKGFLNLNPTREDMEYWGARQGISMVRVVSFTDGTKLQMEQALAANGLGATIAVDGMSGPQVGRVGDALEQLAAAAERTGQPIADYVLSSGSPPGVFIIARHSQYAQQSPYLRNYKLGDGPYYLLLRNYHLCHLEIPATIRRVMAGGGVLLNNSHVPAVSVAAVAKRRLEPGRELRHGIGGFDVRGEAIRFVDHLSHCPIGLLQEATICRGVEEGGMLSMEDVELPDSLALRAWRTVRERVARRAQGLDV
ncbi:MAG: NAD(P)-dependent oxidoreductase [Dehalococcoidia bacterium]|nr:NAD(P)-dependent oxidoreductase [Dehalococcoidia bacterium]